MSDENTEREIATLLMCAWTEYVALYGESPHGTFTQLHSLLALQSAGRNIIALCARRAEVDATDTKRLDWLASQGLRGLRWVARPSITGRGYRLHQSTMIGEAMGDTPRQAIDYAMRDGMNKQP